MSSQRARYLRRATPRLVEAGRARVMPRGLIDASHVEISEEDLAEFKRRLATGGVVTSRPLLSSGCVIEPRRPSS